MYALPQLSMLEAVLTNLKDKGHFSSTGLNKPWDFKPFISLSFQFNIHLTSLHFTLLSPLCVQTNLRETKLEACRRVTAYEHERVESRCSVSNWPTSHDHGTVTWCNDAMLLSCACWPCSHFFKHMLTFSIVFLVAKTCSSCIASAVHRKHLHAWIFR